MVEFKGWQFDAYDNGNCLVCGKHHMSVVHAAVCREAVARTFGSEEAGKADFKAKLEARQKGDSKKTWTEFTSKQTVTIPAAETVACVVCGKKESRKHPGHFMCGSPSCRESIMTLRPAADRALRFLCGLNLQDHPVSEQRELLDVTRALMSALKPGAK